MAFFGSRSQPRPAESALEARLKALITAHFDFVWRSLRRLGLPPAEADEGAQQVFVVASRRLTAIVPASEKRVLFAIVLRVASKQLRALKRRRQDPRAKQAEAQPELSGDRRELAHEQLAELAHSRHELDQILAGIALEQRAVFVLYELEEMQLLEIASWLDLPLETVSSRLRLAREEFDLTLRGLRARAHSPGGKA